MRSFRFGLTNGLTFVLCGLVSLQFAVSNSIAQEIGSRIFVVNPDGVVAEKVEGGDEVELPNGQLCNIAENAPNRYVVWHEGEAVFVSNQDVMLSEEVLEYVDERLQKNPTADDYALKTRVLFNQARYSESMAVAEKALELDSKHIKALHYQASAAYFSGDRDKAARIHEQLLELAEDHYLTQAITFYLESSNGDWQAGREALQRSVELAPYRSSLWANLGFANRVLGDNDEANECFEKAIELDPASTGGYYFMGMYAYADGNMELAIPNLEKCVELNDNKTGAYLYLAEVADKDDQHERYKELIIKSTTCRDADKELKRKTAWELATSHVELRRDGETALKIATELVDSNETEPELNASFLLAKAAALAEVDQFMEALDMLELINPDSHDDLYHAMKSQFENQEKFRFSVPTVGDL